jgi:hypothetical protein
MLRKSVGVVIGLLLAVGVLAAQTKDKDAKKDAKEIKAKVVKVDADKKMLTVTMDDGKRKDLMITDDTKILGPRGGVSKERLKDDRLTADKPCLDALHGLSVELHYVGCAGGVGRLKPNQSVGGVLAAGGGSICST